MSDSANARLVSTALRILVAPALPQSAIAALAHAFDQDRAPGALVADLSDYLWEQHSEELVVSTSAELRRALDRIAEIVVEDTAAMRKPVMPAGNPPGWPNHLSFDYQPGPHQPREIEGCSFYPYDHVPSRVICWLVIRDEIYLGLVSRHEPSGPFQAQLADCKSVFPQTIADCAIALRALSNAPIEPRKDER